MKKLVSVICITATVLSANITINANADGLEGYNYYENHNQNQIVTEYYSKNLLESYETGEIQVTVGINDKIPLDAKSAILIEQSTGKVLYEDNADIQTAPASITKIMSMLLVAECIESGAITLETTVQCSEHAASMGGSQIWLKPNEEMTVHELLKAVAIGSANDATCALGEAIAGSEEAFVIMMNERASQLGMDNTVFKNCSGLDADGHVSTARDIAIMSRELLKHELIYNYTTVWMDTLRNGETQLVNTNKLVRFYEGATGLKTGTTNDAGCCLSASATRNGLKLIAVVMGSDNSDKRFRSARKLLDTGFANYELVNVNVELPKNRLTVRKGIVNSIAISAENPPNFVLPKGSKKDLQVEYIIPDEITSPVLSGDVIGKVVFSLNGKTLGETEIKSTETAEKMNFKHAIIRILRYTFMM